MVIVRDGKEIELTKDEIYQAYLEQESMFDLENIDLNMETYLSKEEYELLKDNKDFMEEAAYELRRNQDKYDMDYEFALKEAFDTIKDKDKAGYLLPQSLRKCLIISGNFPAWQYMLSLRLCNRNTREVQYICQQILQQINRNLFTNLFFLI